MCVCVCVCVYTKSNARTVTRLISVKQVELSDPDYRFITDLYSCLFFFIFQRGNKSDNFHCDECNVCLSTSLKGNHKCFTNRGHDPCAICFEASDPSVYLYLVTHAFT